MKNLRPPLWWPGLVRLWREGHMGGLALAVGFAGLVNAALLVTFVWPEAVSGIWRTTLWIAVLLAWGGGVWTDWVSRGTRRRPAGEETGHADDLFPAACAEYLKGRWEASERLLQEALRRNGRDVEVRLLWATLLRHTGRLRMARRQLRRLERLEAASEWRWEIDREYALLAAAQQRTGPASATDASPDDSRRERFPVIGRRAA